MNLMHKLRSIDPIIWTVIGIILVSTSLLGYTLYQKRTVSTKPLTATSTPTPSSSPTPVPTPEPESQFDLEQLPPSPKPSPKASPKPSPTPKSSPTPTPTPTSSSDQTAPTIQSVSPDNGHTFTTGDVCFTITASDNKDSKESLQSRLNLNQGSWSNWGPTLSPCWSNTANGNHQFGIQIKDTAGNISELTRSVAVASPSGQPN